MCVCTVVGGWEGGKDSVREGERVEGKRGEKRKEKGRKEK